MESGIVTITVNMPFYLCRAYEIESFELIAF